jgi:hypothetical protein
MKKVEPWQIVNTYTPTNTRRLEVFKEITAGTTEKLEKLGLSMLQKRALQRANSPFSPSRAPVYVPPHKRNKPASNLNSVSSVVPNINIDKNFFYGMSEKLTLVFEMSIVVISRAKLATFENLTLKGNYTESPTGETVIQCSRLKKDLTSFENLIFKRSKFQELYTQAIQNFKESQKHS